jgi:regulatory protein
MHLRIVPKTKYTSLVELDGICRGTLPGRVLLLYFPEDFCGEVDTEAADKIMQTLRSFAFSLVLDYLAKAEHSEWQCRNLLRRRSFDPPIIEDCLSRCREMKYLDNSRFAEVLISSWITRKASKRAIIAKLREQRIPSSVWEPLMAELYVKEEAVQSVTDLLKKYCASHRDLPRPKLREKAFTYLYRKGFDLDEIRAAWEDLDKK